MILEDELPNDLISDEEPHASYGGWKNFLINHTELRGIHVKTIGWKTEMTLWFGATNHNYIVLPNNYIVRNYGFWGKATFDEIKRDGWEPLYERIQKSKESFANLIGSIQALTTSLKGLRKCD